MTKILIIYNLLATQPDTFSDKVGRVIVCILGVLVVYVLVTGDWED